MGDPKRIRKKFSKPRHPWQRARLENEKELMTEFGLNNKKQLWKMVSILGDFAEQTKKLTPQLQSQKSSQAEKEKKQFLEKLNRLGLLSNRATLADVLNLTTRDILERRLQTLVHKKGLSKTITQARQFITHGHIMIDHKKITSPSYLVKMNEEDMIHFSPSSSMNNPEHPERGDVTIPKKKKDEGKSEKPEEAAEAEEKSEDSEEKPSEEAEEPEKKEDKPEEPGEEEKSKEKKDEETSEDLKEEKEKKPEEKDEKPEEVKDESSK